MLASKLKLIMPKKITTYDDDDDDDRFSNGCSCRAWAIPVSAIFPLSYWVIFNSVVAYFLLTWTNKYAAPTSVLGYTAIQPLSSAILTMALLAVSSQFNQDLDWPGYNLLGGVIILGGVYLLIVASLRDEAAAARKVRLSSSSDLGAEADTGIGPEAKLLSAYYHNSQDPSSKRTSVGKPSQTSVGSSEQSTDGLKDAV